MHVAVLLYCCLLLAIVFFAVRTPGATFYPPMGVYSVPLWPASQQPYAAYTAICCIWSPCAAKCSPPAAKCTPADVPHQPVCYPVAKPNSTICSVFCNMLHMPPRCSQMQPTGSQIHPPGAKYQPLGSPVANQPAATQTPNSTRNAVMLQCSYGRKIMGAGGRGVSL